MTKETDIEEADPVIAKLQKTGCLEKHYAVLVSTADCFYIAMLCTHCTEKCLF